MMLDRPHFPIAFHLPPLTFDPCGHAREFDCRGELRRVAARTHAIEFIIMQLPCYVTAQFEVWTPWWVLAFWEAEFDSDMLACVTDIELRYSILATELALSDSKMRNHAPSDLVRIADALPEKLLAALRDPTIRAECNAYIRSSDEVAETLRRTP